MKHDDLVPGKTYLVDIGLCFTHEMEFVGFKREGPAKICQFKVLAHFMDHINGNLEAGDIWSCSIKNVEEIRDNNRVREEIEQAIFNNLVNAWNMFIDLNQVKEASLTQSLSMEYDTKVITKTLCNPDDIDEFRKAINNAQRVIIAQQHMRQNPNKYTQYPNEH